MLKLTVRLLDGTPVEVTPTANPESVETTLAAGPAGTANHRIYFSAVEDDTGLTNQTVSATLNWGDGSNLLAYGPSSGSVSQSLTRSFSPGMYVISIEARNYATSPTTLSYITSLVVTSQTATTTSQGFVFGPILPRDSGFPNSDQWLLDSGKDLQIIESSVKMLLITAKGERVMEPEYGTSIRRSIFELNTEDAESIIRDEINAALDRWEPRATLESITISRSGREARVEVNLISRYGRQPFQVNMAYSR